MRPLTVLQELALSVAGDPREAVTRLLTLVCEQLGLDVAFVTVLDSAGTGAVRHSACVDGTPAPVGLVEPRGGAWSGRVATDEVLVAGDRLAQWPTPAPGSLAFARVPLRDGHGVVLGSVCALGQDPDIVLDSRDHKLLVGLAEVITTKVLEIEARVVKALLDPSSAATPAELDAAAAAIAGFPDVERLSRPLLEALGDLTGLASAYLTVIHSDSGQQEIRYARNVRDGFEVPEGLVVPWDDTLCKRSLAEGRPCTTDVPAVWGDSEAARALAIQVYVSVPVETADGQVWGTLCAADSEKAEGVEAHLPTMRLFARLIAAQVEREAAFRRARAEADTDPLTGCASRRLVDPWLFAQLADLPSTEVIAVAFVDLNSFKAVNDTLGHAAGDAVLAEVGKRLRAAARPGDLVARFGGDEFIVAARLPREAASTVVDRVRSVSSFDMAWHDTTVQVRASVGVALSDDHDGASLVARADAEMYGAKRAPRASFGGDDWPGEDGGLDVHARRGVALSGTDS